MIDRYIYELVSYGLKTGLISEADKIYVTNRLLEEFKLDDYDESRIVESLPERGDRPLTDILDDMMSYALANGIMEKDTGAMRDLYDTKLMGLITPPPSSIRKEFGERYASSPKEATDWYYGFAKASNYIRTDRIAKDEKWKSVTEYGDLDITINLSKPEKDPRDIIAAGQAKKSGYPACLLCRENEGFAGHLSHPARQNHRIIPITLGGEQYYLQYSPYVYYNEHCIVFNDKHIPMKIDRGTFEKLLDFIEMFPHYTIGSNADLPIVGGSILSHDHFQGGCYEFPMARAEYEYEFTLKDFPDVRAGIVKWPMSVIRLQSGDKQALIEAADMILGSWRGYSDENAFIYSETDGVPHNTITPIARMRDKVFEMDLVLRNNITTEECPLGFFHPHAVYHHIKKENIGLIEVMGLAVLPARLKAELGVLEERLNKGEDLRQDEITDKHADWVDTWKYKIDEKTELHDLIRDEVAIVFSGVLEDAGVYKRDEAGKEAFKKFCREFK